MKTGLPYLNSIGGSPQNFREHSLLPAYRGEALRILENLDKS